MADEAKAPPAYAMADFLEEIDTIIWEKMDVMAKAASKGNAPIAGLTRIRIDRLEGIKEYLLRIDRFRREKLAEVTIADHDFIADQRVDDRCQTCGRRRSQHPTAKVEEKLAGINPTTVITDEVGFDFSTLKRPAPKVEEKPAEPEKLVHQEPEPLQDKAPKVEEPGLHDDEW